MFKDLQLDPPVNVNKYAISQGFGKPLTDELAKLYFQLGLVGESGKGEHNGQDWSIYKEPIQSMHDGVAICYTSETGGKTIKIINKGFGVMTIYCHLDSWLIKTDDVVKRGQNIGIAGATGTMCFGGHLHSALYEIDGNGIVLNTDNGYKGAVNPLPYLVDLLDEGTLIKLPSNNLNFPAFDRAKVFRIIEGKRYWIEDENTFLQMYDYPVNEAKINEVDVLTYNYYRYGGRILNQSKYAAAYVPST